MFLPIGDEPNPRGTPVVNWALIGINVAVFVFISWPLTMRTADPSAPDTLAYLRLLSADTQGLPLQLLLQEISAYDVFVFRHGFRPDSPTFGTLLSAMFLHEGWLHLGGNMLFLWIFGDNVEMHLGRVRYLAVYLLTGAAATLFYMLVRMDSPMPLVGASGAISGVLGCYFIWFPRNRVRVLMVLIIFIDVVLIPARVVLGFYLVAENLLPFLLSHDVGGGVAYGAHLGGFMGGAGFALLSQRWGMGAIAQNDSTWFRQAGGSAAAAVPRFREALADKRYADAVTEFSRMGNGERDALDEEEVFTLVDWLTEQGKYSPALAMLQRFIAQHPLSGQLDRAHLRAGLLQWRGLGRATPAYQHLLTVLDHHPSEPVEAAARAALREIEAHGRRH
jgi:membrane associated rhomboid family serine protease